MAQELGLWLPPGYIFQPPDMDALGYLSGKIFDGNDVPLGVVPELNVYEVPPWQLDGNLTYSSTAGEFYCFTRLRRSNANNSRPERSVWGFGSWVACGKHVFINDESGRTVGHKTFYKYKGTPTARSGGGKWIMYEYRLEESAFPPGRLEDVRNMVMCLIKRSGRGVNEEDDQSVPAPSSAAAVPAPPAYERNAPTVGEPSAPQRHHLPGSVVPSGPSSSAMPRRGVNGDERKPPILTTAPSSGAAAPAPPKYKRNIPTVGEPSAPQRHHLPGSVIPSGPSSSAMPCRGANGDERKPPILTTAPSPATAAPAPPAYERNIPTVGEQSAKQRHHIPGSVIPSGPLSSALPCRGVNGYERTPPILTTAPSSAAAVAARSLKRSASMIGEPLAVQHLRPSPIAIPSGPSPLALPPSSPDFAETVPLAVIPHSSPPVLTCPQAQPSTETPTLIQQLQQVSEADMDEFDNLVTLVCGEDEEERAIQQQPEQAEKMEDPDPFAPYLAAGIGEGERDQDSLLF